jgi:membrane fusion protein (multidrug efflux system)
MGIRNVSEGAVVTQGVEISTLQQLDPLKMDFMLPEQYHGKVKPSDTVYFTMTGDTNRYAAVVAAVDPGAGTNTRSFRVRALVPNPGHRMVPGSYASVLVPLKSNNNALLIPSRCVIPTTRDKKVALLRNGKATFVVVKLGMRTNDKVEIIQGIGTGDTLITTGLMQIRAEMPVRITKITS